MEVSGETPDQCCTSSAAGGTASGPRAQQQPSGSVLTNGATAGRGPGPSLLGRASQRELSARQAAMLAALPGTAGVCAACCVRCLLRALPRLLPAPPDQGMANVHTSAGSSLSLRGLRRALWAARPAPAS